MYELSILLVEGGDYEEILYCFGRHIILALMSKLSVKLIGGLSISNKIVVDWGVHHFD